MSIHSESQSADIFAAVNVNFINASAYFVVFYNHVFRIPYQYTAGVAGIADYLVVVNAYAAGYVALAGAVVEFQTGHKRNVYEVAVLDTALGKRLVETLSDHPALDVAGLLAEIKTDAHDFALAGLERKCVIL